MTCVHGALRTLLLAALLPLHAVPAALASGSGESGDLPEVRLAADGRAFETVDGRPYVPVGVNYFRPGTGWPPQVWKQFDEKATRRDFERLRDLGANCVRVFLTYGSFYREPGRLAGDGIARFDRFLELAEENGLYVHPTGPDHWEGLPAWARGDRTADDRILEALEEFWRLLASRYRDRSVIFAYDLLNEPRVGWDGDIMRRKWRAWLEKRYGGFGALRSVWGSEATSSSWDEIEVPAPVNAPDSARLLDFQRFRESLADTWTRRQADAIREADPGALVTVGLIQWSVPALLPGVRHYSGFRPGRQARYLDFLEVHFYPLDHGAFEYAGEDSELRNLSYLETVVAEVARPGKAVVVGEFGWYGGGKPRFGGGRHPEASEEDQARWCRRVVDVTAGLATGWLNWGMYDHPQARDVSELTGLFTVEGRPKAWAREFGKLARELRGRRLPGPSLEGRPSLDWQACLRSTEAGHAFRRKRYEVFRAARAGEE